MHACFDPTNEHTNALLLAAQYANILYTCSMAEQSQNAQQLSAQSSALLALIDFHQHAPDVYIPMGTLPVLDRLASAVLQLCDPGEYD